MEAITADNSCSMPLFHLRINLWCLNEKLNLEFLTLGLGKLYLFGFPPSDIFCIAGPPGYASPKILAPLSNASPAASSIEFDIK